MHVMQRNKILVFILLHSVAFDSGLFPFPLYNSNRIICTYNTHGFGNFVHANVKQFVIEFHFDGNSIMTCSQYQTC